jgi:hypothetical protein
VLELMLSIALLAIIAVLSYMTFSTVTTAWKKGVLLSDSLHHGDFVMEQLVTGLRSSFYPSGAKGGSTEYGFQLEDEGSDSSARDRISWVKRGGALVGRDRPFAGGSHRVQFMVMNGDDGTAVAAVRAWRLQGQPDDFDPEQLPPEVISSRIRGFNCRVAYRRVSDEIEWLDKWEFTNRVPRAVELTLYMDPLEDGEKPVEVKRVIGVPVAPLSW